MRVLVTRARADARRTATRLVRAGHEVMLAPVIEITPTGARLPDEPSDAILATSPNAIEGVLLPDALRGAAWLVVGDRLASALRERGFGDAAIVAIDVATLLDAIAVAYPALSRFLYLAGHDRKPELERALSHRGYDVRVIETYRADPVQNFDADVVAALRDNSVDAVMHYSRRSAELFVDRARDAAITGTLARTRHIAISADAAAPLEALGWRVEIADAPDEAALFARL